jgi:hypothetical protein
VTEKLPLWRLIAALFVLGSLVAVLLALAPIYIENFRLQRYLKDATRHPAADETLRSQILLRARQLDLPVSAGDVQIAHGGGKVQIQIKYAVAKTLPLYRVDLHFHPNASEP